MKRFLKDYRLHEHTEALFLLTLGIIIQVLDGSPLDMKSRWSLAWETEFPREYFPTFIQKIIKTVLALIILTRCLTSVLYVIFGAVVICCIVKETSPKLMLPWLFISGVKSVFLTFLEALTGVYVCSTFGKIRKPCIEFIISKAIELFFATYLWACIRSIHKDFESYEESVKEEKLLMQMVIQRVNLRKRRARSMVDETTLYKTANLNYFELKDVPNIIFDMLKSEEELSQDSLISPGMMLASVSNMGSYDYLKTSSSLGELGYIDLGSFQVIGLDDERNLSPCMRAMKFLKLTWDDVHNARERIAKAEFPRNYDVPEKIPEEISTVKPSAILAKHMRHEEVFFADIPDMENLREEEELRVRRKMRRRKGFLEDVESIERSDSPERLIGTEDEVDGDFDAVKSSDESPMTSRLIDGEDVVPDLWLMTNQKDEDHRPGMIESHVKKPSDNYAKLYNQEYMSVIGPEVYDKASKLLKLTSLQDEGESPEAATAADTDESQSDTEPLPLRKKIKFEENFTTHTALPLSIIVTNFPVHLDSAMRCETFYFSRPPSKSAEITLRQNGGIHASGFDIPDEFADPDKMEESPPTSTTNVVSRRGSAQEVEGANGIYYPLDCRRVSLLLLQCGGEKTSALNFDCDSRILGIESGSRVVGRMGTSPSLSLLDVADRKPKLPVLKSSEVNDLLNRNLSNCCTRDLGNAEQISFIRELMMMPIREVLKSYYDLREMSSDSDFGGGFVGRDTSEESLDDRKTSWKFHPLERIVVESEPATPEEGSSTDSSLAGVSVDVEESPPPEGDFIVEVDKEEGKELRSEPATGKIRLGSPKTEKLKTKGNNALQPMYLFGNEESGWSSSPLDLSADGASRRSSFEKTSKPTSNKSSVTSAKSKTKKAVNRRCSTFARLAEKVTSAVAAEEKRSSPPSVEPEKTKRSRVSGEATAKKSGAGLKVVGSGVRLESRSHGSKHGSGKLANAAVQAKTSREIISVTANDDNPSVCSADSEESFSLFYSKTADLASPLLDTRRFIYPDHIHYSYKNVRKKGFDVELNGGLPLLVRDSLTLNPSMTVKHIDTPPDPQTGITRRPMDLTFAHSDAFNAKTPGRRRRGDSAAGKPPATPAAPAKREATISKRPRKPSPLQVSRWDLDPSLSGEIHNFESSATDAAPSCDTDCKMRRGVAPEATLKKEQRWLRKFAREDRGRNSTARSALKDLDERLEASSTRLHSNKGREGVISNPITILQNSKLKKKKMQKGRS